MATDNDGGVSVDENSVNNENYNPKLDFFSDQFDPLLALRTPGVTVPVPDAKIYDNIHMYKSAEERRNSSLANNQADSKRKLEKSTIPDGKFERRWLPHQLPIQTTKSLPIRNIFTRMDNIEGPLKLLRICKDKRLRIKIWTRHSHNIRGYCLGYVIAFDKHWNLALEDVEEIWTRSKKRKLPAFNSLNCDSSMKIPKIRPPKIEIIETTKKTETCRRFIDQMVMRGEHIAVIVVIKESLYSSLLISFQNCLFD